jgi:hypothetical protein
MRKTFRIALANEGKLSDAISLSLSGWAKEKDIQVCLVSEAATARTNLATEGGFVWAAPLKQKKGGSGFLLSEESAAPGGKAKILQCPARRWSIASWRTPGGTGLISAYINPVDSKNQEVFGSFLGQAEGLLRELPRCVVGGDFNAPTGSTQRRALNAWAERLGLTLMNPGTLTYFAGEGHSGSDLDLIFARGAQVKVTTCEVPERGHARLIVEMREGSAQGHKPREAPIAWGKLSCAKAQESFVAAVKAAAKTSPNLDSALQRAAERSLGRAPGATGRSRPLPPAIRREVAQLRKSSRKFLRGSPEYQEVSREIGRVMRRHRLSEWKKTLAKLASSSVVEDDTWRLLKFLQRSEPTARLVGIPDHEVRDAFATIYQSNPVRRSDWVFSTPSKGKQWSTTAALPELDAAFTSKEVIAALSTLPSRKAPGVDGTPHEAYKVLSRDPELVSLVALEATELLLGKDAPPLQGRLVPIPKKGAPSSAADMRPLMMLPSSRKVVEKLVAERIARLAERQGWDGLHPSQGGFRRGLCIERQLVLAQVAILDARKTGRPLRAVGLDLVKAFDRIPKEFAAHCAAGFLRRFCPKLADLVVRLTLTPFEARVGDETFVVSTGVPQGSILSPWLFAMAMNDLSLRLDGAGGYRVCGVELSNLHFADDILQLDEGVDSSERRLRLTRAWVEEWGGEIHPGKTQWLDVNATGRPGPEGLSPNNGGGAIDYLGVILTPTGVKPAVGREVMAETLRRIRTTMVTRGIAPAPALQILRSVAWAKLSHGAAVTLPDGATLTFSWLRAAREVLCTFNQVHRAEVMKELGLLYHPLAWLCRAVIRVYGTALTTDRDPLLQRVLKDIVGCPTHPLRRKILETLAPTGISWEELATVPVPDLYRKADGRLREWVRGELLFEATRLGLNRGEDAPLWRQWSDGPRKYLSEENARYGFIFRRSSMSPPDIETEACHFCGLASGDRGRHILVCPTAGEEVPLPLKLANLSAELLEQALLLEDGVPRERLRLVLEYMRNLYSARAGRRLKRPQPARRRCHASNPDFLKFRAGQAPELEPAETGHRKRKARQEGGGPGKRSRTVEQVTEPLPASPSTADLGEDNEHIPVLIFLDEPCHEELGFLPEPPLREDLALGETFNPRKRACDGSGVASPAAKRSCGIREVAAADDETASHCWDVSLVDLPTVADPTGTVPPSGAGAQSKAPQATGPWTAAESEQLAAAVLAIGESSTAALARLVPTRDRRSIKTRLSTVGHRQAVAGLRAAREGAGEQGARELPALASLPAPEGSPRSPPSPKLATSGDIAPCFNTGRWSFEEKARLEAAVREFGRAASGELLSKHVGTRSARQCFDRLKERAVQQELGSLLPSPSEGTATTSGCESGRWSAAEISHLVAAVNRVGDPSRHAEVAEILGDRTAAQVAAKVADLARAGRLTRPAHQPCPP